MDSQRIEQMIAQAMPDARIAVNSEDNVHFHAQVVSASFAGLSRLKRHRLIHQALGAAMGREIHALTLDLKTPEEV